MLPSNIKTVRNDMKSVLEDAREMFREATSTTGERADELRNRGMALLDTALGKAQEMQAAAVEKSKEAAHNTDEFVQQNPWKAVAISAGVGLLLGMLASRK